MCCFRVCTVMEAFFFIGVAIFASGHFFFSLSLPAGFLFRRDYPSYFARNPPSFYTRSFNHPQSPFVVEFPFFQVIPWESLSSPIFLFPDRICPLFSPPSGLFSFFPLKRLSLKAQFSRVLPFLCRSIYSSSQIFLLEQPRASTLRPFRRPPCLS